MMRTFILLTTITLAALAFAAGCNNTGRTPPAEHTASHITEGRSPAEESIAAYLTNPQPTTDQEARAINSVENAQVIFLDYKKVTPSASPAADAEFALSLKASHATPLSHHEGGKTYAGISLTFSRLFGDAQNAPSRQWLREMRLPLEKDYRLIKINVVLTPSREVRKESMVRSQAAVKMLSDKLAAVKADFLQLSEYEAGAALNLGGLDTGDFPSLNYEHAIGPDRKGSREKYADDWCDLSFNVSPISGNPQQRPLPTVTYPRQGLMVQYRIVSASDELNAQYDEMVKQSLKPLDDYERELAEEKVDRE